MPSSPRPSNPLPNALLSGLAVLCALLGVVFVANRLSSGDGTSGVNAATTLGLNVSSSGPVSAAVVPTTPPLAIPIADEPDEPVELFTVTVEPTATPEPTATIPPTPVPPTPVPPTAIPATAVPEVDDAAAAPAVLSEATTDTEPIEAAAESTLAPTTEPALTPAATATETPAKAEPTATVEPETFDAEATATATPMPTPTPTVAGGMTIAEMETYSFEQINQVRARAGLAELTFHSDLAAIARDWSEQMAGVGRISHRPGEQLGAMLPSGWRGWAENVAEAPTIVIAQSALEQSPGHYANMTGDYGIVGVGAARDARGQVFVTHVFAKY